MGEGSERFNIVLNEIECSPASTAEDILSFLQSRFANVTIEEVTAELNRLREKGLIVRTHGRFHYPTR